MENNDTFAKMLLRIYDKKMMSGQITFFASGITKADFTGMCTDSNYKIPMDRALIICEKMNITGDEKEKLLALLED